MAIVVPAPGELESTARALLALADDPREVRTAGNGTEFDVPDSLADRYHGVSTPSDDSGPAPARPVKRRGRAPRVELEG